MVFVTHSIEEAVLLGDRVIVLKGRPEHPRDDHDRPAAAAHARHAAPAALRRAARAGLGHADEARRAKPNSFSNAEKLNKKVNRSLQGGFHDPQNRHTCGRRRCCWRRLLAQRPASAQGKKIMVAMPGIPPIFSVTDRLRRGEAGLLQEIRRRCRDPPVRQRHRRGARGGRRRHRHVAVADAAGDQPGFQCRRAAGGDLRHAEPGLGARHRPTTGKTCKDMVGQDVGVDSVGGARSVALRSMLTGGCPDVKIEDVKQVALGSNARPGDDRRPAHIRRAASRRPRRDRSTGQEAATSCWP